MPACGEWCCACRGAGQERLHLTFSGPSGQLGQQMLAIGRALMTNPRLLVRDDATEGLAPVIRDEIWARLKVLKAQGLAMLIVDKEIDVLVEFADRHYAMEKGEVAWSGSSAALLDNEDIKSRYLGL